MHSDKWGAYANLERDKLCARYLTVNHSQEFVDAASGAEKGSTTGDGAWILRGIG